jgi:cytochrome c oxidase subunit 2
VYVCTFIFIVVGSVLAYTQIRFRAKSEADEHAAPPAEAGHGNPFVEIGLIAGSVIALVIIAVPTLKSIWYTYDVPAERKGETYEVNATGVQWWFKFEYPSEQIKGVGTLVTANELVIPAGRPVRINVRSLDVIHSFWVPKLAGKVDMIPNRANFLWFQADKPGYFWGQCAEYCGDSHAVMRFRVVALSAKDFGEWLDAQSKNARDVAPPTGPVAKAQFAALREFKQNEMGVTDKFDVSPLEAWRAQQAPEKDENPALVATGKALFVAKTCSSCHTIRGHGPQGVTAPDLTHFGARTTLAAGLLENNPEQLQRWIHNPGAVKPGNKMYVGIGGMAGYMKKDDAGEMVPNIKLSAEEEVALVAYLRSLK